MEFDSLFRWSFPPPPPPPRIDPPETEPPPPPNAASFLCCGGWFILGGGGCDIGGALVNACAFKLEVVVTEVDEATTGLGSGGPPPPEFGPLPAF